MAGPPAGMVTPVRPHAAPPRAAEPRHLHRAVLALFAAAVAVMLVATAAVRHFVAVLPMPGWGVSGNDDGIDGGGSSHGGSLLDSTLIDSLNSSSTSFSPPDSAAAAAAAAVAAKEAAAQQRARLHPPNTKFSIYNCGTKFPGPGTPPDFMVIGVHKGGSTALYSYLAKHASVRAAICKEINFFNSDEAYAKGKAYYLRHYKLLDPAEHLVTGEGTPNYIRVPTVPRRVMGMFPKVKLIVTLREPSTRFESQWVGMVDRDRGEYRQMTCEAAWQKSVGEIERCLSRKGEDECMADLHENGIVRSIYLHQVQRWLAVAPSSQFLVIQAEQLFRHTNDTMQQVARFLGLRPFIPDELDSFKNAIEGSHHLSEGIVNTCKTLKHKMDDFFRPYNVRLEKLLRSTFRDLVWNSTLWK